MKGHVRQHFGACLIELVVRWVFRCVRLASILLVVSKMKMSSKVYSKRTNTPILDYTHKPPIAVAVIQQHHGVTLGGVCLSVDGCNEVVKCIDEFKIDILCASSVSALVNYYPPEVHAPSSIEGELDILSSRSSSIRSSLSPSAKSPSSCS